MWHCSVDDIQQTHRMKFAKGWAEKLWLSVLIHSQMCFLLTTENPTVPGVQIGHRSKFAAVSLTTYMLGTVLTHLFLKTLPFKQLSPFSPLHIQKMKKSPYVLEEGQKRESQQTVKTMKLHWKNRIWKKWSNHTSALKTMTMKFKYFKFYPATMRTQGEI